LRVSIHFGTTTNGFGVLALSFGASGAWIGGPSASSSVATACGRDFVEEPTVPESDAGDPVERAAWPWAKGPAEERVK